LQFPEGATYNCILSSRLPSCNILEGTYLDSHLLHTCLPTAFTFTSATCPACPSACTDWALPRAGSPLQAGEYHSCYHACLHGFTRHYRRKTLLLLVGLLLLRATISVPASAWVAAHWMLPRMPESQDTYILQGHLCFLRTSLRTTTACRPHLPPHATLPATHCSFTYTYGHISWAWFYTRLPASWDKGLPCHLLPPFTFTLEDTCCCSLYCTCLPACLPALPTISATHRLTSPFTTLTLPACHCSCWDCSGFYLPPAVPLAGPAAGTACTACHRSLPFSPVQGPRTTFSRLLRHHGPTRRLRLYTTAGPHSPAARLDTTTPSPSTSPAWFLHTSRLSCLCLTAYARGHAWWRTTPGQTLRTATQPLHHTKDWACTALHTL